MERWLPVEGYPDYEVSDEGGVRSHKKHRANPTGAVRYLKPYPATSGHMTVRLYNGPTGRQIQVHVLMMAAFAGPRPEGMADIRHLDGDPAHNVLSNLAYGTHIENAADMVRHGRGWAGRTQCIHGHEFTAENTYLRPDRPGHRTCRTCMKDINRRRSKNRAVAQAERV